MPDLRVRPMTQAEFDRWRLDIATAYADEQVEGGHWRREDALDRALSDTAQRLPQGLATAGMLLLEAERADGTVLGRVWLGLEHPRGTEGCAFLYDIEIDDHHRGRGHGRALLAAAERVVRERGATELELNVFGGNTRAIALYASAGYVVVQQQMRRTLT